MKSVKLAAAISAGDLANLSKSVKEASDAGVDLIHIDVADGHFAPYITFGAGTVAAIRSITSLPLDTHLLTSNPENHVEDFIKAGSDILTIHVETCDEKVAKRILEKIEGQGRRMGLALKPRSVLPDWSKQFLDRLHLINVMTVEPGLSGHTMDMGVLSKLADYSKHLREANPILELEVDGGVGPENAENLVSAGATILVAGGAVYRKGDVSEAVRSLKRCYVDQESNH
jgi:ribulose-phosphate 3-epimerase